MDFDSAAMITSMVGLIMAPFWAAWSRKIIIGSRAPTKGRTVWVVVLSLAALMIFHVGPWIAMSAGRGTLAETVMDRRNLLTRIMHQT